MKPTAVDTCALADVRFSIHKEASILNPNALQSAMGSNMSSKWRAGSRKTKATCMPRNYPAQFRRRVIALGTILLCASELAFAQSPAERRGLRFVSLNCARCHAIDKVSKSPLAIAPPFRTLHLKYPVSDLQRPLAQGVHPIMPRFQLDASQVEDIMAYLKTLER